MSSVFDPRYADYTTDTNITTRRVTSMGKLNMAGGKEGWLTLDARESHKLESILSQDEARDVISMLGMADELGGVRSLPGFYTSTQMGIREPKHRLSSPPLSPVLYAARGDTGSRNWINHKDDLETTGHIEEETLYRSLLSDGNIYRLLEDEGGDKLISSREGGARASQTQRTDATTLADPVTGEVNDRSRNDLPDPLTQSPTGTETKTITLAKEGGAGVDGMNDASDGSFSDSGSVTDGTQPPTQPSSRGKTDLYTDAETTATRLAQIDDILDQFSIDSIRLSGTVKALETSLEYSQKEITDLKKENAHLKLLLANMDAEDRRTQYQIKDVADKLDKLDSVTKKRNLIFEGVPEGRKEATDRVICNLFDRLNLDKGIYFDACYRVGPFNEARPRPILVSFERQADRDLVYSRRMDLKDLDGLQKVWINEDVSPESKRRREMIRLIAREAQHQGIDCRTGKYALHINRTKFDDNSLEDLPPPLRPSNLKQIKIDDKTLAYQSEHAPFSNFFNCQITIGKHKFFCAEQAIQFLKAKTLNKPLAATRIYLSRDVRFIKQTGHDIGTSDEWDACKYDHMYICLKKKFEQNPDLLALLLSTNDMELVEATPDRLWGCGVTLSSNLLKRHAWTGMNKHGKILMTVRDELRRKARE